jgi:hypothetical protein
VLRKGNNFRIEILKTTLKRLRRISCVHIVTKKGHTSKYCWSNPESESYKGDKKKQKKPQNNPQSKKQKKESDDEFGEEDSANMCTNLDSSPASNSNLFILDGGANKSHTNDYSALKNPVKIDRDVRIANNEVLKSKAKGSIGQIRNVQYTPGLVNLLSERQLLLQGYSISKRSVNRVEIRCQVTDKLKGVANADKNGLWLIDPRSIRPIDQEVLEKNPSFLDDHAYFGSVKNPSQYDHVDDILFVDKSALKSIANGKLVKGLEIPDSELKKKRPLKAAKVLAAMPRVSDKKSADPNKTRPDIGHTVQTDVYGKLRQVGLQGELYIAFFIDKGGGISGAYPLKLKSDFIDAMKDFIAFKKHLGDQIRCVESDRGREIINKDSKQWLRDQCIFRNTAAAYKHNHTATVNAHIRRTLDMARTFMINLRDKPLGIRNALFPYAVTHAMWIRNRSIKFRRNDVSKTPYEWTTGRIPDLGKLCYWGCPGYVKIPVEIRGDKSSEKALVAYFIGYDLHGKGTLVYVPGKKKPIIVGDFIFDEVATKSEMESHADKMNKLSNVHDLVEEAFPDTPDLQENQVAHGSKRRKTAEEVAEEVPDR